MAVHEAGHAVAAVVLGAPVAWVDVEWRPGEGGTLVREVDPHTDAVVALAGYEASGGALAFSGDTHDTLAARELVGEAGIPAATLDARRILIAHRYRLLVVASALLDHGRITGEQVTALVRSESQLSQQQLLRVTTVSRRG
ncbi:hypothetical protein GCE86_19680 [Micromonospora terminaliae]|uniref:Peptidase M41 domain-containing protein n=1 Tax=Micromonospora terminaliae TaxID=1914461 RepID=A0AAJ2ZF16_9ACTN|nr:hypothetical protein [Micromonospora terminaliae]NES28947.1 hypothetical protein [Micromonospora terminaliae]QGL49034.1 hypothetical protein GCE86_19680 [Micromonospora terminaliae]